MPTYEYRCQKCGEVFTRMQHIEEHDKRRPQCPKCKSRKVEQLFGSFFAKTSKKS